MFVSSDCGMKFLRPLGPLIPGWNDGSRFTLFMLWAISTIMLEEATNSMFHKLLLSTAASLLGRRQH